MQDQEAPALKRRLGLGLLVLYGTGITVGAGIYVLIGAVAGHAGRFAPWSFVIAAIAMAFTVASYAELASRFPVSAGEAAYVRAAFDRAAYTDWLHRLRAVCSERGIVLIFDEVFVGFRLAPGGAQEYFDVRADMVTYGKTLGGGLPVGVVCGRADLMRRFRDDRPADVCFARGTFNAHPYVQGAMHAFLERLETPPVRALYDGLDARWDARARRLNDALQAEGLPVRVANLSTIWTAWYPQPSRYHWMLQYYLRAEGLALSWVGSGRLVFSLNYGDAEFDAVAERFLAAARAMQRDGWWWTDAALTGTSIRRRILREMLVRHR